MQTVIISENLQGLRADIALAKILDISRSSLKNRIKNLLINNKPRAFSYIVNLNDSLSFLLEDLPCLDAKPQNIALNILYEDDALIVVNKHAGLVVHAGGGTKDNTLVNALLYHFDLQKNFDDKIRPGIVHRLDKDTSGVIIVAKNVKMLEHLQNQFASRTITKEYRAIVYDNIKEDKLNIDSAIGRDPHNRKKMKIDGLKAKHAETEITVIKRFEGFTYLSAFPKTGRTHQIRVHLAMIKHPVAGDKVYAKKRTDSLKIPRQLLHAYQIFFSHPGTGKEMNIQAPLPQDIEVFLNKQQPHNI